jgi:hypothetical protein
MPRGVTRFRAPEEQSTLVLDTRTNSVLSGDQNDYDLSIGASYNLATSGGDRSITGIAGGLEGRVIQLVNLGPNRIFLINESSSSLAQNRILTSLPDGSRLELVPNQSLFLSYNNVVSRWLVMDAALLYQPETDSSLTALLGGARGFRRGGGALDRSAVVGQATTDSPLTALVGGARNFVRSGGFMATSRFTQLLGTQQGYMKLGGFTVKTNGPVSQAFGVVSSFSVSFTMPKVGTAIAFVAGAVDDTAFIITADIGARFDSDTPQRLNGIDIHNGAGDDNANLAPLFGFLPKSALSVGNHTADFCFGNSTGSLLANSTYPAYIAVIHEA